MTQQEEQSVFTEGYDTMHASLSEALADDVAHVGMSPQEYQEAVHAIAVSASQNVARGSANHPVLPNDNEAAAEMISVYDRGQRKAIRDWSHQQNQHWRNVAKYGFEGTTQEKEAAVDIRVTDGDSDAGRSDPSRQAQVMLSAAAGAMAGQDVSATAASLVAQLPRAVSIIGRS